MRQTLRVIIQFNDYRLWKVKISSNLFIDRPLIFRYGEVDHLYLSRQMVRIKLIASIKKKNPYDAGL